MKPGTVIELRSGSSPKMVVFQNGQATNGRIACMWYNSASGAFEWGGFPEHLFYVTYEAPLDPLEEISDGDVVELLGTNMQMVVYSIDEGAVDSVYCAWWNEKEMKFSYDTFQREVLSKKY